MVRHTHSWFGEFRVTVHGRAHSLSICQTCAQTRVRAVWLREALNHVYQKALAA